MYFLNSQPYSERNKNHRIVLGLFVHRARNIIFSSWIMVSRPKRRKIVSVFAIPTRTCTPELP
jgi:hypothetical protein